MIVVNIVKIIIYINVIKMTNITLCTKVNLLFLCNIELNTNDTQMNENLFSIIFINDKSNIITLSDWEFQSI